MIRNSLHLCIFNHVWTHNSLSFSFVFHSIPSHIGHHDRSCRAITLHDSGVHIYNLMVRNSCIRQQDCSRRGNYYYFGWRQPLFHYWRQQIVVARTTTITLAGDCLFSGIDDGNSYCFRDCPPLSSIDGGNFYCFGWWRPGFRYWWRQVRMLWLVAASFLALVAASATIIVLPAACDGSFIYFASI